MDNDSHSGNSSAGARTIRKPAHHRRYQRRVIRQKRRRRKDRQLHVHKQGAQGAHQRHGNELFGAPPIRVLKMDMLRLFRHKITCLFHPDSNRWYWDLTSSAGMRTNTRTGRGLIGSTQVLACATAPLWHRPIYRQWGIPPRPETATASVARAIARASMPRVICGGDQLPQQPRSPPIPK